MKSKDVSSIKGIIDFINEIKSFEYVDSPVEEREGEKGFLATLKKEGTCGFMDAANVCGIWTNNVRVASIMAAVYDGDAAIKKLDLQYSGESSKGSKYSAEYLKIALEGVKKLECDSVRLMVKDDFPLTMEWTFGDKTKLWFICAPRVENE